jgi:hypothetical protein
MPFSSASTWDAIKAMRLCLSDVYFFRPQTEMNTVKRVNQHQPDQSRAIDRHPRVTCPMCCCSRWSRSSDPKVRTQARSLLVTPTCHDSGGTRPASLITCDRDNLRPRVGAQGPSLLPGLVCSAQKREHVLAASGRASSSVPLASHLAKNAWTSV